MDITLRPYQKEALQALDKSRSQNKLHKDLIVLPTGAGKTIVAGQDLKNILEGTEHNGLFLAHRDELLNQCQDKLEQVWPTVITGKVKAEQNDLGYQVTIGSVQTLCRQKRLNQLVRSHPFKICYIDEAHHAAAKSYRVIIDALREANPDMWLVGLTATPMRADSAKLNDLFDVAYSCSMLDLMEEGYLADLALKRGDIDIDIDKVEKKAGDFKPSELSKALREPIVLNQMARGWKRDAENRRTLAFCVDIAHTAALCDMFRAQKVACGYIHGGMSQEDRTAELRRFESGEYRVLCNCMILTEGFDDASSPDDPLSCIMLARPTMSQSLYIQQVGRGTRPGPKKKNCLVLDYSYNSKRHQIVQLPILFGFDYSSSEKDKKKSLQLNGKSGDDKDVPSILAMVRKAKEVDISTPPPRVGFNWAKGKSGWTLSLGGSMGFILIKPEDKSYNVFHYNPPDNNDMDFAKVSKLTSKPLSFEWAFGLAEDAVRNIFKKTGKTSNGTEKKMFNEKGAAWRELPPTEGQQKALKRLGKTVQTRGEASDIISAMIADRTVAGKEPATEKQRKYLWRAGADVPDNLTKAQASKMIMRDKKARKENKINASR